MKSSIGLIRHSNQLYKELATWTTELGISSIALNLMGPESRDRMDASVGLIISGDVRI